jgi:hypothetical protein
LLSILRVDLNVVHDQLGRDVPPADAGARTAEHDEVVALIRADPPSVVLRDDVRHERIGVRQIESARRA